MLAKVKRDDRLVLMGDLNGRVGRDVETWGKEIGRHGEEMQNEMLGDSWGPVLPMV